MEYMLDI